MNKKIHYLIMILLLCIFTANSNAQNAVFEAQLQTTTQFQNNKKNTFVHNTKINSQLQQNKKHSIGLHVQQSALFKTLSQTRASNYTKPSCQQQTFSNQTIHFDNTFQTEFNVSSQSSNSIYKVTGDTGSQDPPETPLHSELPILILLLTVYLSIKK